MNTELAGTESGLIGYWTFNKPSSNTIYDETNNITTNLQNLTESNFHKNESAYIKAISQGDSILSEQIEMQNSVFKSEFTVNHMPATNEVVVDIPEYYQIDLQNSGGADNFTVTVSGGNWDYAIVDTTTKTREISTVYCSGSYAPCNEDISLKVTRPSSGTGDSDTVTVQLTSFKDPSSIRTTDITTTLQTSGTLKDSSVYPTGSKVAPPLAMQTQDEEVYPTGSKEEIVKDFTMEAGQPFLTMENNTSMVRAGKIGEYSVMAFNDSFFPETFTLSILEAEPGWTYTILNVAKDSVLTSFQLDPGVSKNFIVQVQVPLTVTEGATDSIVVNAYLQAYMKDNTENIITTATTGLYENFDLTANQDQMKMVEGGSQNYVFSINNNGTSGDTYDLTIADFSAKLFEYTICNASGTAITSLTVGPGSSENFYVNAKVPTIVTRPCLVFQESQYNSYLKFKQSLFAFDNGVDFTIESWVYLDQTFYNNRELDDVTYLFTTINSFDMSPLRIIIKKLQGNTLACFLDHSSNAYKYTSTEQTINTDEWAHIAVSYTGDRYTVYVNGEKAFSEQFNWLFNSANWYQEKIGDESYSSIKGKLTDFRIWSVAKTPEQIKMDMNNILTGNETGLEVYYDFNTPPVTCADDGYNNCIYDKTSAIPAYTPPTMNIGQGTFSTPSSEDITVTAISQGCTIETAQKGVTTYNFKSNYTISKVTAHQTVDPYTPVYYEMKITNQGSQDSYTLAVSGGSLPYSIVQNKNDAQEIKTISLDQGYSSTFYLQTFTSGPSETVTVTATSSTVPSKSESITVATTVNTYGIDIGSTAAIQMSVYPGDSHSYTIFAHNTGSVDNTYTLTVSNSDWPCAIRDLADTSDINSISVGAGLTENYLVKVSVPKSGISNGESKSITLNAVSQKYSTAISDSEQLTTMSMRYEFATQFTHITSIVSPGKSYNYNVRIMNNGTARDTYNLSTGTGSFNYEIRNSYDNATINTVSIEPGNKEDVIVKVSVPIDGIANGQADSISFQAVSQSMFAISDIQWLTTTTSVLSSSMSVGITRASVTSGDRYAYTLLVQNSGTLKDSFNIALTTGSFKYDIRNAANTAFIKTLTVEPGSTEAFLVVVNVPETGLSNGVADTITVSATSQANPSLSYTSLLISDIPTASFNMQVQGGNMTLVPGQMHKYVIDIQNNGSTKDTYDLITSNGRFLFFLRNAADDAQIKTLSVDAGQTAQCLLKVTVPLTGISNGQSDTITIKGASQSNPSESNQITIITATPSFSHNLVKKSSDAVIYPGRFNNYLFAIENTGLTNDTYDLSLGSGSFSYTIRNASDTADIHSISVDKGLSSTFIVKATFPSSGATNGQSESIQVDSVSQGHNSDTSSVQITTSTPSVALGITNLSGDMQVYPGKTNNYEMVIENRSQGEDTFDLSISGGAWSYSIRNASDTANIYSVSLGAGMTQTFFVKALVPLGVTNGSSESITVTAISQGNRTILQQETITTTTPSFSFTLHRINQDATLNPGQPFTYTFVINNTSTGDDTFSLTKTNGKWTYTIRNATDTANINALSVGTGLSGTFLVNGDVPLTLSSGETDSISLYVASQSNKSVNDRKTIITKIANYAFNLQNLTGNLILYAGQQKNYHIQLNNTGNASDTYELSVNDGTFAYTIRNAFDKATINSLSVDSGQSKSFIIKAAAPVTGIANGHTETITLTVVSVTSISESLQITTSAPQCAFDISPKTNTASIIPGNSRMYPIQIQNNGSNDDTYGLTLTGGNWPKRIVNAVDNSTIDTLFVAKGKTALFYVKVDVPATGVSVGDSDRIYLKAISLCNLAISDDITFTTDVPSISYELQTASDHEMVLLGKTYGYRIDIQNKGTRAESFNLSITSADFNYDIRNEIDSANIKTLIVPSGETRTYLAKVLVPTTGVSNAQSDTVTTKVWPQGEPSNIKQLDLVTTTPTFDALIHQVSPSDIVYPGQSKGYIMQIDNTGASMDTYSLSLVGGNWQYAIRNADDIATIDTVSVDGGYTGIFLVRVDVPLTNVANGASDTVTINAMSQGNNSINFSTQITTTTPTFSYTLYNISQAPDIYPGSSFNHVVAVENTGAQNDAYDLSLSGGKYSYVIRNLGDYANIDAISVDAGLTNQFVVKVTVPSTGVSNAQSDTITIRAVSQGNSVVYTQTQLVSTTPLFGSRIVKLDDKALVYPGKSHYYPIYIENTGTVLDAFDLSVTGGSWIYDIRNETKDAQMNTILLTPGESSKFFVKTTVPFTGVANGASDTITVKAISQGLNIVVSSLKLVTDSPYYEFNLKKLTSNKTIFLGETFDYHIELNNTGSANDCYSLTVSGGNWPYTIRNANDNTVITSLPMPAGYSDTFRLRVTMPQTGVASGEAETVTVKAQSQNNQTIADQVLVTTASPFYDVTATRLNFPKTVNTEETYNYEIDLNNLGNLVDTFTLSLQGGIWTYAIRNASDTQDITSITINAESIEKIIVGASVPITNVSNGDNDSISLSVASIGNPSVTLSVPFVLTAANYRFDMVKNFDNAQISPERSAVYEVQINNTDTSNDSYLLTVDDSNWTYTFRNPSDTQDITSIYVPANSSQEFFVKVTAPLYGVSEGDLVTATVKAVSIHKASVKDQVVIFSKVAAVANKFAYNAMKETIDSTVNMGRSYDYKIQIVNNSISADEFHLSLSGGNWPYGIRNQNDISDIGCMTVLGNSSRTFVVRVTVPTQNISSGDTDTVNVSLQSNTTSYGANFQITTTAKQFFALSFVGSDTISVSHQNEFNVNPITIETWLKPTTLSGSAQDHPIVSKLGTNSGWELRAYTYPEFLVAIDGIEYTVGSSAAITPNEWTHLAATYDDKDIKLYVNGVLRGTKNMPGSISDNSADVSIGGSSLNTGNTFTGDIDDVRIWNTARTSEQINDFIELNLLGTETGLIANWPFEEGTGTNINDISTNAINTSLANATWLTSPVTLSDVTYSFIVKAANATIEQGKTHQYKVVVENAGPTIDTYNININGGAWPYTLLDALGTSAINSLTISSGYSATCIIEVSLPVATACFGDQDSVTLTVSSQNDTALTKQKIINSSATYATSMSESDFAFKRTALTEYDNVQIGDSLYYLYNIENKGIYCNDFSMKNMSGRMQYSLYDESDLAPVDSFTLRPGENTIIVLKASDIQTGYTAGDMDLTILKLVAHGNSVTEYNTVTTTVAQHIPDYLIEFKDGEEDNDIPIVKNMNYSYCQSIYLKEEIQRSGEISSLYLEYSQPISETYTNVEIYMGFTSKREFVSTSDWVPLTQLTKVYSGNLTIDERMQWDAILLDTAFVYDTLKGHLVVAIDDNGGLSKNSTFYSSKSIMNRSLVFSDNSTNPDPNLPASGELKSAYPNIRLSMETYDPYGIELTRFTLDSGIRLSESFNYSLTIENKGLNPDTYTFTTNGAWTYQIRNASDTVDITNIALTIGESKSFWLKLLFHPPVFLKVMLIS
ncbi:MAG: hypothetical protein HQK75_12485 [Candidatus Magnetomorum sp.]|nr:hypothetical protein [Candidatus Magnetomorum sp.]